jgi:hypothetical protein
MIERCCLSLRRRHAPTVDAMRDAGPAREPK